MLWDVFLLYPLSAVKMFNKFNSSDKPSKGNWAGRTFSAAAGAVVAAGVCIAHGQPAHVSLWVACCATVFTLVLDEMGWI
ncbi:hypothetical protein NW851_03080 [Synechococcus sp. H55.7]|uniref:hypothetical protein n=1 Tax=unclassified Synechococcus TaxID=2626047 RepID=UPI0039C0CCF5